MTSHSKGNPSNYRLLELMKRGRKNASTKYTYHYHIQSALEFSSGDVWYVHVPNTSRRNLFSDFTQSHQPVHHTQDKRRHGESIVEWWIYGPN